MYPELATIERVTQVASAFAAADALGCSHVSLPVPAPGPEGLRILFLHCAERNAGGEHFGAELSEPRFISAIDAESGLFLELTPFVPATWGLPAGPGWYPIASPRAGADETLSAQMDRFNQTFDRVTGLFARGRQQPLSQQDQMLMRTLDSLFRELAEPPLLDTYDAVGRVFFAWLRRASV